jgi:AmmeMemoRadiSam system protein B
MSLVFAAIAPHPPLLVPTIGKEMLPKVNKTKEALEKLEEDLYLSKPDCVVVISPHGPLLADAFTIHYNSTYVTDFKEFGDLATKQTFNGEMQLPPEMRGVSKKNGIPATLVTEEKLDHGTAVPLMFLTSHLQNVTVLPIGFSGLDSKTHLDFGYLIKDEILKTNKRVAVIASGDLSHALTTDAPGGYNAAGPEFDKKIQELLASHNTTGMLGLETKFLNDAAECGFRSFLVLMGILRDTNYTYQSYAYEAPFGVGYLTANFLLS